MGVVYEVKLWRCEKCLCFLQVIRLDKKVECAACGSRAITKVHVKCRDGRPIIKNQKCLFCEVEAGSLCSQSLPQNVPQEVVHGLS
jgi:hypothetical protein